MSNSKYVYSGVGFPSAILNTTFFSPDQKEMIRIASDGFYVRGVKLEQDEHEARKLYDALMIFMSGWGVNKTQIRQEAIEECAVLCEGIWTDEFSDPGRVCAGAIRKLKERK